MTALATDYGRKSPARLAGSAVLACQSDDRLVALVREGHERAFEGIVARYRRPLLRYCGRILPESRVEDALQQALVNAHAALVDSDDPVALKPWLYAITRNAALNMLRQNGWNYEPIPLDFDGVRRPDQVVEERFALRDTVAAVNALPKRQRDALVMREFEGRSYEEIALALGTGDGAVRQLLNRARGSLRAIATALMPPPIVTRVAASLPPGDGRRAAELFGGVGAAGVAKLGAGALVAGSLVVGAVKAPLVTHHTPTRDRATLVARPSAHAAGTPASRLSIAAAAPAEQHSPSSGRGAAGHHPANGRSLPRHGAAHQEDRRHSSGEDHRGSGDSRTGSGDGTRHGSGDGTHSGSGSPTRREDSTRHSGSDDGPSSGGTSTSGSDDNVTITDTSGSGSDGSTSSGSGSDGSGSGGSITSGSGTSGSGSGDSITSGSGSGDSGSTGSGSSSGDSGSTDDGVSSP